MLRFLDYGRVKRVNLPIEKPEALVEAIKSCNPTSLRSIIGAFRRFEGPVPDEVMDWDIKTDYLKAEYIMYTMFRGRLPGRKVSDISYHSTLLTIWKDFGFTLRPNDLLGCSKKQLSPKATAHFSKLFAKLKARELKIVNDIIDDYSNTDVPMPSEFQPVNPHALGIFIRTYPNTWEDCAIDITYVWSVADVFKESRYYKQYEGHISRHVLGWLTKPRYLSDEPFAYVAGIGYYTGMDENPPVDYIMPLHELLGVEEKQLSPSLVKEYTETITRLKASPDTTPDKLFTI